MKIWFVKRRFAGEFMFLASRFIGYAYFSRSVALEKLLPFAFCLWSLKVE